MQKQLRRSQVVRPIALQNGPPYQHRHEGIPGHPIRYPPTKGHRLLALGIGALTAPQQCRYDVCAVIPDDQAEQARQALRDAPAMVSLKEFVPGYYASMPYDGSVSGVPQAWRALLEDWLPGSGFAMGTGQFSDAFANSDAIPGQRHDDRQVSQLLMPVRATLHAR